MPRWNTKDVYLNFLLRGLRDIKNPADAEINIAGMHLICQHYELLRQDRELCGLLIEDAVTLFNLQTTQLVQREQLIADIAKLGGIEVLAFLGVVVSSTSYEPSTRRLAIKSIGQLPDVNISLLLTELDKLLKIKNLRQFSKEIVQAMASIDHDSAIDYLLSAACNPKLKNTATEVAIHALAKATYGEQSRINHVNETLRKDVAHRGRANVAGALRFLEQKIGK